LNLSSYCLFWLTISWATMNWINVLVWWLLNINKTLFVQSLFVNCYFI
jgi:hypothetical protein